MKYLILLIALVIVGCTTHPVSTKTNGSTVVENRYLSQGNIRSEIVEQTRRACYAAIVDLETAKMKAMQPLIDFINSPNKSEMAQVMALQMWQNQLFFQQLVVQRKAPIECNQMGVYEYKIAQTDNWLNFGGKVVKGAVSVILGKEAFDLGHAVIDKLAEPKIQAGDGSVNFNGSDNLYQPDNRTGTCVGELVDGTCVHPIEEEIIDEVIADEIIE